MNKEEYVIYAEDTWCNYRALFWCREGKPEYMSEANADKFTKEEAERRCPKGNGKYNWVIEKV